MEAGEPPGKNPQNQWHKDDVDGSEEGILACGGVLDADGLEQVSQKETDANDDTVN